MERRERKRKKTEEVQTPNGVWWTVRRTAKVPEEVWRQMEPWQKVVWSMSPREQNRWVEIYNYRRPKGEDGEAKLTLHESSTLFGTCVRTMRQILGMEKSYRRERRKCGVLFDDSIALAFAREALDRVEEEMKRVVMSRLNIFNTTLLELWAPAESQSADQ